ncbi:MAG: hypothetical protein WBE26_12680 [Phycisphaerae bacterium]
MTASPAKLEQLSEKCLFCDPEAHGQGHQVLLRSDHFYLFAAIGAIVDGYIIIAPYRCDDPDCRAQSLSQLPPELIDELSFLRGLVSDFYRTHYGGQPGMSFEHGRAGGCLLRKNGTKHCYHAHLCCYPVSHPLWEDITDQHVITLDGLHALRQKVGSAPYLYIEACDVDDSRGVE